jgi:hypothetical protein
MPVCIKCQLNQAMQRFHGTRGGGAIYVGFQVIFCAVPIVHVPPWGEHMVSLSPFFPHPT